MCGFLRLRFFVSRLDSDIAWNYGKLVPRPVRLRRNLATDYSNFGDFLVTSELENGVPVSSDLSALARKKGQLTHAAFGLEEKQLEVTRISPRPTEGGKVIDMIGIVTALEGEPLPVNGKVSLDAGKPGFGVELKRDLLVPFKGKS